MTRTQIRSRGRDIHENHRAATPLELLFDLTFVVAIAQAAAQLHHGIVEHHTWEALLGFVLAFAAIWWAWMNYTWFASAYDNDDAWFRVLTMVQMGGVLVLATGIKGLFTGQYLAAVVGYVVMRLALCVQWLRAAWGDPGRRRTCLRYAFGVSLIQIGWVGFLLGCLAGLISGGWLAILMILLWICELAVPMWAERAGETPWHAHHIAERYGLMTIIVLGECVLGATNAVGNMWQAHGWTFDLGLVGFSGMVLIFCLWWMYFLMPSGESLHLHRERAWGWGYGHFVLFAATAAVGSGLEVVADVLGAVENGAHLAEGASNGAHHGVSSLYAISMVAIAEATFVIALWALHRHATRSNARHLLPTLLCLGTIGLGPLAAFWGLPLAWSLLLLSLGPVALIIYHEHGRRHCTDHFAVR